MSKSIPISPRHGLNPSMDLCFWCGEPKGIALMGKLKGDVEAPRESVFSYEPCDKCGAEWDKGLPVIEVVMEPPVEGVAPFGKNEPPVYPTGRWLVFNREAVSEKMRNEELALCDVETFQYILDDIERSGSSDKHSDRGE